MSAVSDAVDYLDVLEEIEHIAIVDDINDFTRRMALGKIRDIINKIWEELGTDDDDEEDK